MQRNKDYDGKFLVFGVIQTRRQLNSIFKLLKEKIYQSRIVYPANIYKSQRRSKDIFITSYQEYFTQQSCPSEMKERYRLSKTNKALGVHHHWTCLTGNAERSSSSSKERTLINNVKTSKYTTQW